MRRLRPLCASRLAVAAALIVAAPAAALGRPQPAIPYAAALSGPDPAPGLGVALPVRIVDGRTGAPAAQVRVVAARLVSPFGAAAPVQLPSGPEVDGVRRLRADLPAPGPWALELTLASPIGAPVRVAVGFTVAQPPARPLPVEAQAPAAAPADPAATPLAPAVTAPGPAQPDPSRGAGLPPR